MTNNNHIDKRTLERYVAGQLSAAASEIVILHLETCDACIDYVETLWAATDIKVAIPSESEGPDIDKTNELERRLIGQVHRSNLGGTLVQIGLGGFLDVFLALLRPLMGVPTKKRVRGEGYD